MGAENLAETGIRSPDRPTRLPYPGPLLDSHDFVIYINAISVASSP
jgi:hypothetical protein